MRPGSHRHLARGQTGARGWERVWVPPQPHPIPPGLPPCSPFCRMWMNPSSHSPETPTLLLLLLFPVISSSSSCCSPGDAGTPQGFVLWIFGCFSPIPTALSTWSFTFHTSESRKQQVIPKSIPGCWREGHSLQTEWEAPGARSWQCNGPRSWLAKFPQLEMELLTEGSPWEEGGEGSP